MRVVTGSSALAPGGIRRETYYPVTTQSISTDYAFEPVENVLILDGLRVILVQCQTAIEVAIFVHDYRRIRSVPVARTIP